MIFELASTWKEGLGLIIFGTLMIFTSGLLKYKREQKERKEVIINGVKLPNGNVWYPNKTSPEEVLGE